MNNINFNFIQLNSTPTTCNHFYNRYMQSILQEIIENDDICRFVKFIKIPNIELYEHQSNILKLLNTQSDKSFLNLWDRQVGYTTICAMYILYSSLIKHKNILIINNSYERNKQLNDLIVLMYDSLPTEFKVKNFHVNYGNSYFETENGIRSKIIQHSWNNNNTNTLRGMNPDICIINEFNEFNMNVYSTMDLIKYIHMMECFSQIVIHSNSITPKMLLEFKNYIMTLA